MERREPPAALLEFHGVVLDVGSADRWLQKHIPVTAHYVALDYPATGQALYGARPDIFADATCLPFQKDTFDAVACLEVIEHVRSPESLLVEIARVLRPQGVVHISMPFLYPHDAPHDYQRWTQYGWHRSAERAGLKVMAIRPVGSALQAAGVLTCLALAGPLQSGSRGRLLWLPVLGALILLTNVLFFALSKFWPPWEAMASGYELELRKA